MKDGIHPKYYTPKQAGYARTYLEKLDEIKIRVPQGKKAEYKKRAETAGKSLNQYIIDCIEENCGWIPCKNKMPDVGSYVTVSTKNGCVYGDVKFNYRNIYETEPSFFFDEGEDVVEFEGEDEVVAWQPMPKAYKEGLE